MKIFTVLFIVFLASTAYAGQWCMWNGAQGIGCQSDSKGYIIADGFPTSTPSIANNKGYYKLITTPASLSENQAIDQEVWGFSGNQITKTWTVRDMTITEIDNRLASPMSLNFYYIWRAFLKLELITTQQAIDNLPPEMIDAYQARKRLLGD